MTADRLADPANICTWNPDMYGLRAELPEAALYYRSLLEMYASWGVDFIKCDDICRQDAASARRETKLLHDAVLRCGRPIVLSLSPDPARISEADFYTENANMWRITDDFWDSWPLLKDMFRRCELWENKRVPGGYPDCDMLPLGMIGGCFGGRKERMTRLTKEEQRTMMSLWCIFGSPLMLGAELTRMDSFTLSLLTNRDVLEMHRGSRSARQLFRTEEEAVWIVRDEEGRTKWIALFNLSDEKRTVRCRIEETGDRSAPADEDLPLRELWTGKEAVIRGGNLAMTVPAHGVKLLGQRKNPPPCFR